MYRFTEYCECGGQLTGSCSDFLKGIMIKQVFWATHSGLGHAPVSRNRCYKARRENEGAIGNVHSIAVSESVAEKAITWSNLDSLK